MSRHRIVRSRAFQQGEDSYDEVSDDDEMDCGLTDRQAQKYMFDRSKQANTVWGGSNNAADHDDDDYDHTDAGQTDAAAGDEYAAVRASLSDEQRAILLSCIDQIRDVVGAKFSEPRLAQIVIGNDYDVCKSLDEALNSEQPPPPEEIRRLSPPKQSSTNKAAAAATKPVAKLGKQFARLSRPNKQSPQSAQKSSTPTVVTRSASNDDDDDDISGASSPRVTPDVELPPGARTPTVSKAQSQRNVRALFDSERAAAKATLHMVVVGHVDAGKSTLMGHTLLDLGAVTQRTMHKHERDSQKMGKSSFMYAWVLDETGEERERGITMDVGSVRFETDTKSVTLLDAPGHKDFIPNMISGATQADVALLVVDATRGEFETGFEQGGQTREHAILVRSLGVSQLGVVVNKLDTVGWSQQRFDEILAKLRPFLAQCGYKAADVTYVPCSGLTGENLVRAAGEPELTAWYSGPTLAKVIDTFKVPPRNIDQPFRMTISDIFKATGSGLCLAGRVETGALATGDKIYVCPLKEPAIVKAVMIDEGTRPAVFAGDHVTVTLAGLDMGSVQIGSILCDIQRPVPIVTQFQARIVVFSVRVPLTVGSPVLLHHQSLVEPASIGRLKALLHKQTGEVLKKGPRCLGNGACALVVLQTSRPICVEAFADCRELGRVTLRVDGVTVAAGVVTKVMK